MKPLRSRHRWFQFTPAWKLSRWGVLPEYLGRLNRGGDGVYRSRYVIVPLVGEFCWFDDAPDPYARGGQAKSAGPPTDLHTHAEAMADALEDLCWCEVNPEMLERSQAVWQAYVDWARETTDRAEEEPSGGRAPSHKCVHCGEEIHEDEYGLWHHSSDDAVFCGLGPNRIATPPGMRRTGMSWEMVGWWSQGCHLGFVAVEPYGPEAFKPPSCDQHPDARWERLYRRLDLDRGHQ